MNFIDSILATPSNNVIIGAIIIPISIIIIGYFVKTSSDKPKLIILGSNSLVKKDQNGRDIRVFGIEIANSTKFLWIRRKRQTAVIQGYDVYSSLCKEGHSVHLIWNTAHGESYEPIEFVSAIGNAAFVRFLAYYEYENYFYIIQRINDDHSITLGPEKIPSGSLKVRLVLRDNTDREYSFKITPKIIENNMLPVSIMPISVRIEYIRSSINYLKIAMNYAAKAFKLRNF